MTRPIITEEPLTICVAVREVLIIVVVILAVFFAGVGIGVVMS